MSHDTRLETLLERILVETAVPRAPDRLRDDITSAAGRVRQRPRWLAFLKESPMRYRSRLVVGSPMTRVTAVLVGTIALLVALTSAAVVGASMLPSPALVAPVTNGLIAFSSNGYIWLTDAQDSARTQLTSGPSWDSCPTWSPQGDRIAYWTQRTPQNPFQLWVMDADGSDPTKLRDLVDDLGQVTDGLPPAWSPDGTAIAYSLSDGTSYWIETVDLASGQHMRLTDGEGPSWSPDGTRIAYQGGRTRGEVWTIHADGTSPMRLVSNGAGPVWSPRGDLIAYYAQRLSANDIWIVDPGGGSATNITESPDDEYWPSWSFDGSRLAFDRSTGAFSSNQIVVSSFDGSDPVRLQGEPVTGGAPAWAPDGTLLLAPLFEMQQGEYGLELFDTSGGPSRSIPAEGHLGYDSWQVVRWEP